jgi:hypothetical protein
MISMTPNLESSTFISLIDSDCAALFRQADIVPPPSAETGLGWQSAPSRGAVKDRLVKDENVRVALIAADSEEDPLLRDLARNIGQLPSRSWLHVVLITSGRVSPPLLALLRHFASWSVLLLPSSSDELRDTLIEAADKSAERHRLAMLSTAIRAEAEDLLVRTRNIVGALQNAGTSGALGNLVNIADRLSGGTPEVPSRPAPRPNMLAPETAVHPAHPPMLNGEESDRSWTRNLIDLCSTRQNYFPEGLFSDPAWDMLLDLTYARLTGKRVSVSSLCIASRVPATTALRRISDLVSQGLATRIRDENDGRRVFVDLTEDGFSRMTAYIENVRGAFGTEPRLRMRKA